MRLTRPIAADTLSRWQHAVACRRAGAASTACIDPSGGMAVQLATILPALICAHVLGLILLLYSLEKTFSVVSRTRKRLNSRVYRGVAADLGEADRSDTSESSGKQKAPFRSSSSQRIHCSSQGHADVQTQPAHCAKNEPWSRGCSCQVGHADKSMSLQLSER